MKKHWLFLLLLICSIFFTWCDKLSAIIDDCLIPEECTDNTTIDDLQDTYLTAYGTEPFWDIEISWWIATFSSPMYDTDVVEPITIRQEWKNYYFSWEELEWEFILKDCIDGWKWDMHYYTVWVAKIRDYYYEWCGDWIEWIKMSGEDYEDRHSEFLSKYDGYIKNCEHLAELQLDKNATDFSYGRYNYSNIWDSYKIDWYVSYTLDGNFYSKDLFCAFTDWDFGEYWDEIEYNSYLRITTKDEEEQECIDTLDQYPPEQMPWDPDTITTVSCYPKDYYWPWYITWYIYTTTYPDLWLRISTPAGWNMLEWWDVLDDNSIFNHKADKPIFARNWNKISYWVEYIQVYEKDKNENIEDAIRTKHLKDWCTIDKYPNYYRQAQVSAPYPWTIIYSILGESDNPYWWIDPYAWESCVDGDWEDNHWLVWFFEWPDKTKYYKMVFSDWCAPGPCSIFGEVEVF